MLGLVLIIEASHFDQEKFPLVTQCVPQTTPHDSVFFSAHRNRPNRGRELVGQVSRKGRRVPVSFFLHSYMRCPIDSYILVSVYLGLA